MTPIISVDELKKIYLNTDIVLLDASLPKTATGKVSEFQNLSIPSARIFDIKKDFVDKTAEFPNTVPSAQTFQSNCEKLGINKKSKVIIFDAHGLYSSPRVKWLFNIMGHDQVSVLDGGLPAWVKSGSKTIDRKELTIENQLDTQGDFVANIQSDRVISYSDILDNLEDKLFTVIDARSEGRFSGIEKEPRAILQSGCIPNSINLPFQSVLENGHFKTKEELVSIFNGLNLDQKPIVFSCGSGMTACIILLAAELAGYHDLQVFDGSWTEWATKQKLFTNE